MSIIFEITKEVIEHHTPKVSPCVYWVLLLCGLGCVVVGLTSYCQMQVFMPIHEAFFSELATLGFIGARHISIRGKFVMSHTEYREHDSICRRHRLLPNIQLRLLMQGPVQRHAGMKKCTNKSHIHPALTQTHTKITLFPSQNIALRKTIPGVGQRKQIIS
jgi:hypothetical protein